MLTKINYEVKGQLAKLLATEDLIIENRKVDTAMFDVERRVLTLPMWEKASASVYDLLVGHEVGHALYTPADNWKKDYPELPMSYVNILEDVRIEKLMKRKYAGIVKTFFNGYKELSSQDFFELSENEVEEMNLPDRLNINAKIGNFVDVPFSDNEDYFVNKAIKTETFQEVLDLSVELFDFMKEQIKDSMEGNGGDFSKDWQLGDDFTIGESTQGTPSQTTESDQELPFNEEKEEEWHGNPTTSSDISSDSDMGDMEAAGDITGGEHGSMDTITDKKLSENLENLNNKDGSSARDPEYCTLPDLKLDNLHIKVDTIHSALDDCWITQQKRYDLEVQENTYKPARNIFQEADNNYRLFRRSAQKEVNYLVKEFEMRKSADAYSRATVSKTGVLDCTKLHSYKYNEDLFKKITTIPDGKNHGLIFILDWSGSMSTVLMDTIKQLFNLIWFCKKVQIPFQVFAFSNEWNRYAQYDENQLGHYNLPFEHHAIKDGQLIVENQFAMMEFLSSDVKKKDLEHHMLNIWRTAQILDSRGRWDNAYYYQAPHGLGLSGTPLNEALVSLNQLIPQFKKKTGVQKIQCITLTDGEAHPISYHKHFVMQDGRDYMGTRSTMHGSVFIRDNNGKTHFCGDNYHHLTASLIQQLRGRFPDVNFIGIRVLDNRESNSFIRRYSDWDQDKVANLQQQWRKTKSVMVEDGGGYHAYFGLSSSALNQDSEFTVKEDATKAQIKTAFKKSLSAKKMNKKVLGQFMEFIA
tara:strand:- start:68 stop:2323 length:2256 start_codon:yes stop_codon:yes gene_type:complete